ncbi:FAD binding domain-containing protein [Candidatus Bipolaricaulota sp. J31]
MKKTGPVEIVKPKSLAEAVEHVREGGMPLAGGTDVFVRIRKGAWDPPFLVYIGELPELRTLEIRDDGAEIGAAVTHAELLRSGIPDKLPIFRLVLEKLGAPAIREMGTIGGNVANASPAGDTLIPLYLLEARVNLVGPQGERSLPIEEFILGPGKTALEKDELIKSLWVPFPEGDPRAYFHKVGRRRALYIAVLSLGALLWLEGDVIREVRLALGAVAPTVVRPRAVEERLRGRRLVREELEPLCPELAAATNPITDVRGPDWYRREAAGRLLLGLLALGRDTKTRA